jgi:DNA polymerase epsilon subunit 1
MRRGRGTYGLVSSRRGRGSTSHRFRGRGGSARGRGARVNQASAPATVGQTDRRDDGTQLEARFEEVQMRDEIDEKLGFSRFTEGPRRDGWLINMHPVGNLYRLVSTHTVLIVYNMG